MTLGYDKDLFILAFDHRGSFQKTFFGVQGEPTPEETARIVDAKRLIFEGARRVAECAARAVIGHAAVARPAPPPPAPPAVAPADRPRASTPPSVQHPAPSQGLESDLASPGLPFWTGA